MPDVFWLVLAISLVFVIFFAPIILSIVGVIRRSYVWFMPPAAGLLGQISVADEPDDWRLVLFYGLIFAACLITCMNRRGDLALFRNDE